MKVHLGVEADFRPARKAHPALLVSELQGLVQALHGAGVDVVDDEPLEGYDRVYVSDPFCGRSRSPCGRERPQNRALAVLSGG